MYYANAIRCGSLRFSDRLSGVVSAQTVTSIFWWNFNQKHK